MACVYALTSSKAPSVVRYIGISKHETPNRRLKRHFQSARDGVEWPVCRWVRKHAAGGYRIDVSVVVAGLSWAEACAKEIELIARYRTGGGRLLNLTDGGEGRVGLKHTEESNAKNRAAHLGKTHTDATKEKNRVASTGRKHSESAKAKCSAGNLGRKHTEAARAKMGATHAGKPLTAAHRAKLSDGNRGRKHTDEAIANMVIAWQKRRLAAVIVD